MSEFTDPCPAGGVFIEESIWGSKETYCPECGRAFMLVSGEERWPDHSRARSLSSVRPLDFDEVEALKGSHDVMWMEFTLTNGDIIVGFYPDGETWEGTRNA